MGDRVDGFWKWDPKKGGYTPSGNRFWKWDAEAGVLRPDGGPDWSWDPKTQTWVEEKKPSGPAPSPAT